MKTRYSIGDIVEEGKLIGYIIDIIENKGEIVDHHTYVIKFINEGFNIQGHKREFSEQMVAARIASGKWKLQRKIQDNPNLTTHVE